MVDFNNPPNRLMKELEEARKHIEELEIYCSLVEGANDGFIIVQNGRIQFLNQNLSELTGLPIDEILNKPFTDFISPNEQPAIENRYQRRIAGIPVTSLYETSLKVQDEDILEVEINEKEIDYRGEPADLLIIRDLTKRRKSEEKLGTFQSFIDSAPDSFTHFDSNLKLMDINLAGLNRFLDGTKKEDIIGKHMTEVVPGIEHSNRFQLYQEVLETGKPIIIEELISHPRFGDRYVSVHALRIKDGLGIISRDITMRKKVIEALLESEGKYRTLVEKMEEAVFVEDHEGKISFVNPKAIEMVGYEENDIIGKHWSYFAPEEELEISNTESSKRPGGLSSTYESTVLTKESKIVPVKITATPLFTEDQIFNGVLCIFTDITEIKQAQKLIQESEEKYRNLVERSFDGITIVQDSLVKYVNPSLARIIGYSAAELIDTPFSKYIPPDKLPDIMKLGRNSLENSGIPEVAETVLIEKDGTNVDVEINASLMEYQGKTSAFVYVRDITEQKRANELLLKVKREEELYHTMQSHFIKNDLQKLAFSLELNLLQMNISQTDDNNIENAIQICHQASRNIDIVNNIFSVLQSKPDYIKTEENLLNKIQDVSSNFKLSVNIDEKTLNQQITLDKHFSVLLSEIFTFIASSGDNLVYISGSRLTDIQEYFIITLKEIQTTPLPKDLCNRLSKGIEEEKWESLGHYIGLTLASVIAQYYRGKIVIRPLDDGGNEFNIYLPSSLVIEIENPTIPLQ